MVCVKVRKKIKYTVNGLELIMKDESLFNLILGIIKAILLFIFRLALLIPMLMLTIIGAILGAGERAIGIAIWKCICHPFNAFAEAIRSISYEIKSYKNK